MSDFPKDSLADLVRKQRQRRADWFHAAAARARNESANAYAEHDPDSGVWWQTHADTQQSIANLWQERADGTHYLDDGRVNP